LSVWNPGFHSKAGCRVVFAFRHSGHSTHIIHIMGRCLFFPAPKKTKPTVRCRHTRCCSANKANTQRKNNEHADVIMCNNVRFTIHVVLTSEFICCPTLLRLCTQITKKVKTLHRFCAFMGRYGLVIGTRWAVSGLKSALMNSDGNLTHCGTAAAALVYF
jgi:hypothetical protein